LGPAGIELWRWALVAGPKAFDTGHWHVLWLPDAATRYPPLPWYFKLAQQASKAQALLCNMFRAFVARAGSQTSDSRRGASLGGTDHRRPRTLSRVEARPLGRCEPIK